MSAKEEGVWFLCTNLSCHNAMGIKAFFFLSRVTLSDLHLINLKISGSSLEDGLALGENGYRDNSKLYARNEEMRRWTLLNREAVWAWRKWIVAVLSFHDLSQGHEGFSCLLSSPCPKTHHWKVVGIPWDSSKKHCQCPNCMRHDNLELENLLVHWQVSHEHFHCKLFHRTLWILTTENQYLEWEGQVVQWKRRHGSDSWVHHYI